MAGFVLAEALYPSGLRQPKHSHDLATLGIVLAGGYTERLGRRVRICDESNVFFNPAGETHSVDYDRGKVHIFNVRLTPQRLQTISEKSDLFDRPLHFNKGVLAWLATRLYNEFNFQDNASHLAIEGITFEILAEATRCSADTSERIPALWLQRVVDLLHDRFSESLALDQIANSVGIHPAHLARTFRKRYNCTIGDYVRHLRVEFATRELSSSDTPLFDIALSAGFCDQSHFSRIFKLHMGVSPAEYRKSSRQR